MRQLSALFLLGGALSACDDATRPEAPGQSNEPPVVVTPGLALGSHLSLNVNAETACSEPVMRGARVVAVTQHAVLLADTANPAGGFSTEQYREIGETFDRVTWAVNSQYFGEPSDIDRNGKVLILFTRAVNELTPADAGHVVSGFFHSRDLFPVKGTERLAACAASNESEMFYMLAPDPEGTINGNKRSVEAVRRQTFSTLGHELEHLVNASRRLFVNNASEFEENWLDEGLAHIAEELNFYAASGLAPRQNIDMARLRSSQAVLDAVNAHQVSNLSRYSRYLRNPEGNSLFASHDSLATRGAAWAFLRYAADRRGVNEATFWRGLVNSTASGMANLTTALGGDPLPWIRDWTVSVYADDLVALTSDLHEQPSWNYRSVLPTINRSSFPLKTHQLTDGKTSTVEVRAGSAAHLPFSVSAGERAEIRTEWGTVVPQASCREGGPVRALAVGEAFSAPVAEATSLCFDGGVGGADFVFQPFHASTTPDARTSVSVTGVGVTTPATATSARVISAAGGASLAAGAGADRGDGGFELRLRESERRELGPRIRGGSSGPRFSVAAAEPGVTVTVLRTR